MLSIVYQADKRLDAHGLMSAQWGPPLKIKNSGSATVAELAVLSEAWPTLTSIAIAIASTLVLTLAG